MKYLCFAIIWALNVHLIYGTDECGISHYKRPNSNIAGGREARKGEFPWMISVQKRNPGDPGHQHHCGASVINRKWILTATHCLRGIDAKDLQIVAGAHDIKSWTDHMSRHMVEHMVLHPDFDNRTGLNDIALIKVKQEFLFEEKSEWLVNSVCLPKEGYSPRESLGTAVGWGRKSDKGALSKILKTVDLPILKQDDCRRLVGYDFLKDQEFCAGGQHDKDTCTGDSGGPVTQIIENRAVLVGITSAGLGGVPCGSTGWPAIYTDVSKYIHWINEHID
ncbi:unnamed protein product [Oppiella nova]|uniref:limulus clotting factor C n=1 Tax=Oppiella nova TaxID=334625 RepID=A0A7R9M3G4_9ACAR|nr:unnamed protein product [Oppiella nova]CAG2170048.1 unnamed protein product [Oppiella nova]